MNFMIAQWVGIVSTVIALVGVQFQKINHVLFTQILTNLLSAVSFGLLGGLSGAWICLAAIVQTVVMFWFNQSGQAENQRLRGILAGIFCAVYVLGTAWVYRGWGDLISGTCAVIFALAVVQKDSDKFRGIFLANSILWLLYDLTTGAYTNMLMHSLSFASTLTAILRFRRGKKEKESAHG